MLNPIFKENVEEQKHPGSCAFAEPELLLCDTIAIDSDSYIEIYSIYIKQQTSPHTAVIVENCVEFIILAWWHHQMESFSTFLSICVGNSPVTGEFPAHRPVTWSLDAFFDLCLNKRLSKQSWGWWCEMPLCTSWRHCNLSHEYHYDLRCGHCDGVLINCFCFLGDLHNKIMVINNLMLELYLTLIKEWNLTYSFWLIVMGWYHRGVTLEMSAPINTKLFWRPSH